MCARREHAVHRTLFSFAFSPNAMPKTKSPQQKARAKASRHARELKRCRRSRSLQGCRRAVFESGDPNARAGKLQAKDLAENVRGKVVSKRKSELAMAQYDRPDSGLRRWNEAARRAFDAYDADGLSWDGYDEDMEYAPNYDEGGYASGYDDFPSPPPPSPPRPRPRPPRPSPREKSKRSNKGVPRPRLDL